MKHNQFCKDYNKVKSKQGRVSTCYHNKTKHAHVKDVY